ncbi:uncharacterized protein TEOVI_000771700 [Trypanosoma equiperdum]|uniref:Uncharacterized protein n=4 Tax=Trypanozoon TaxID=39700 RepID=Q582Y6_TRYB2|nr:hypothetical protein, conserved [Trypanosoma brucei gambiense DAL972]XP_843867.1 hypothetical protein, conserved [Trypanosoma brucei brucei TREU927]AAX80703.1 hypothetical protein, conserved [Trypanosoma brucei]RHW73679.1 hypothetical protein DPX39_030026400 [Trypanosoma brucei equiperdum]SCU67374.1 hypothetical protein, conserved [Trypanosoma equiperdum]AAZ10308.1 hypothetical protein, conserved [Trypanosoma brucei brucei TREU927]CBH09943.1 hypothetical protein, conserved [Trypanosoma bru|eukprot:XP_011772234.1 hypothetical protein, conserved [Trypanosoma brucei gambiense DAL972]
MVPLPALPRMLLAEGFQRMLEGQSPQRDLRALFEEAEMEAHRLLLDMDLAWRRQQPESHLYAAIRHDPLSRLLAYELYAICGYYVQLMSISGSPEVGAAALLRTLIASDVRTDHLLQHTTLRFEALPRDVVTGERLHPCEAPVEAFVKECLLLERDAFGRFRFDPRGDNRLLMHCLKLDDIVKTPKSFSVVLDPLVRRYGNFDLDRAVVYQGRWMQHRLACREEEHRVDERLPLLETVGVKNSTGEADTSGFNEDLTFIVRYNDPICRRHKETSLEKEADKCHVEVFELAVEDTARTFWEKWFLDR